jgi:hypothetical protein
MKTFCFKVETLIDIITFRPVLFGEIHSLRTCRFYFKCIFSN